MKQIKNMCIITPSSVAVNVGQSVTQTPYEPLGWGFQAHTPLLMIIGKVTNSRNTDQGHHVHNHHLNNHQSCTARFFHQTLLLQHPKKNPFPLPTKAVSTRAHQSSIIHTSCCNSMKYTNYGHLQEQIYCQTVQLKDSPPKCEPQITCGIASMYTLPAFFWERGRLWPKRKSPHHALERVSRPVWEVCSG